MPSAIDQEEDYNAGLCLNHRKKHGLVATEIAFDLMCINQCEVESTCPLRG